MADGFVRRIGRGALAGLAPALVLLTCAPAWSAETPPRQQSCVPVRELTLRRIPIGADGGAVRLVLGNPRKMKMGQSEDDGGTYRVTTLQYRDVEVDVGRAGTALARVERLLTRSPRSPLPSGVQVGMPWEEALARWQVGPDVAEPDGSRLRVRLCEDEPYPVPVLLLHVTLGDGNRIREIEIRGHGP